MLRSLVSRFTRGGAAGRARPPAGRGAAGARGPAGTGATRSQDEAIGRGVRTLLRRVR